MHILGFALKTMCRFSCYFSIFASRLSGARVMGLIDVVLSNADGLEVDEEDSRLEE